MPAGLVGAGYRVSLGVARAVPGYYRGELSAELQLADVPILAAALGQVVPAPVVAVVSKL